MTEQDQPAWKEFQDVIARIEQVLGGGDVVIQSPDHIRDLVTGALREVDASLRRKVGSADVLITFECRRHKDAQDVTWIEQLVGKRKRIGASLTVAVSTSGFTAPAIEVARQEGILLRTFAELNEDGLTWLRLGFSDLIEQEIGIEAVLVELYEEQADAELLCDEEALKQVGGQLDRYPYYIKVSDGTKYDSWYVLRLAQSMGYDPFDGAPEGASKTVLKWECYDRGIEVDTSVGRQAVKAIRIRFTRLVTKTHMPIGRVFQYAEPGKSLAEGVELVVPGNLQGRIQLIKDRVDGRFRVALFKNQS